MISFEVNQSYLNKSEKINISNLKKIIDIIYKELKYRGNFNLSLVFVNNQRIKQLNKKYRNIDKVTDVLSFGYGGNKRTSSKKNNCFGEIIISYPQAKKQARLAKHSLKNEIDILFIHGILHLLGYDHEKKKEQEIMKKLENKIFKLI